ncbi:MAG: clostripain-related cysteine peptidase [Candidatus Cryptobacteroides sp.]
MKRPDIFNIFRQGLRIAPVLFCVLFCACTSDENFTDLDGEAYSQKADLGGRKEFTETRRVLLFYESGYNDLASYLDSDMNTELVQGFIPTARRNDNVLLVFSKLMNQGEYVPVKSYLRRLYTDDSGNMCSDTLLTLGVNTIATSTSTLQQVLNFVKESFPAKGYGMVFSSHGSGWLPQGYYFSPTAFENEHADELEDPVIGLSQMSLQVPVPQGDITEDPYYGMTRSIGMETYKHNGVSYLKELDIKSFAEGIPYRLDFLLFDMCFSSGIEMLYGLKDKTDLVCGSPCEVLASGMFDYTRISEYLIGSSEPDVPGLLQECFDLYDRNVGVYRSSTMLVARTEGIENVASVCSRLFEKYRSRLGEVNPYSVQPYHRNSTGRRYFYDIVDIFVKCGAEDSDVRELRDALEACTVFKANTPSFMNEITFETYSGVSMFLPVAGTPLLRQYYRNESWNEATGLVK